MLTTEPHTYTTGDQAYPFNFLDNTSTPMSFNGQLVTVTCADDTHITLDDTTASGAWSGIGFLMSPIPITDASISGDDVMLTLERAPIGDLSVGYGEFSDSPAGSPTGGFDANGIHGGGRCGLLTDSYDVPGPLTGMAQPNRMVEFSQDNIS